MPSIGSVIATLRRSGSSNIDIPNLGWVGSKAGIKHDIVVIDTNGRADQAVATSTALNSSPSPPPRVAILGQKMDASAAQNAACNIEKWDEDCTLSLPCANSTGVALATADNMKNKQYALFRDGNGNYVVNTSANGPGANPIVECVGIDPAYPVGEVGGLLVCRLLPTYQLA